MSSTGYSTAEGNAKTTSVLYDSVPFWCPYVREEIDVLGKVHKRASFFRSFFAGSGPAYSGPQCRDHI